MDFRRKNILITGASSGIGEAIAIALAEDAAKLILIARRKDRLDKLSEQLKLLNTQLEVITMAKDITMVQHQIEIVEELSQKYIMVDILINNAGTGDDTFFKDAGWQKLEKIIELNVKGLTHVTHLLVFQIIERKGAIVFISSGAGIAWMPGSVVYSASKHFVTALAMGLYGELKPLGIQVSLVCPGPVESEFNVASGIEDSLKAGPSSKMLISSAECAEAIIRGVKKGKSLIFPGKKFNRLMKLYINFPWFLKRKVLEAEVRKFNLKVASK